MSELDPEEQADRMVAAVWITVESLGVPDTPMRRVLFQLARLVGLSHGDELALASATLRALLKEMQEVYNPKTPLEQQLEYIRLQKELQETTGVTLPDVAGDSFELPRMPETPAELADELGYQDSGRAVRRTLREKYPHAVGSAWGTLTEAQVKYVRAHLKPRPRA
jgi:hypothetical protein